MFYKLSQEVRMKHYTSTMTLSYHTTEEGARREMTRQECHNRLNGFKVTERTDNGTFMTNESYKLAIFYLPCNFMD